ncbi:MAG: AAA family ATPase [Actinobacteria bacterium]|nr:AAA family ATPase [Actinomycetota bacterium]
MPLVQRDLPSGTVTFLFSDVEGSTRLLEELGAEEYSKALAEHRRLIREACTRFGGVEVDTQGDAFFVAFPTAPGAVEAAQAISDGLGPGPIRVRLGLHTGTPLVTDEGYVGADVHRAARIAAAGHGGQVLVSASTAGLVQIELRDLGEHRFKDLAAPERVFQLGGDEYPPLRSLRNVRLPVPATPFLGRELELQRVVEFLVRQDVRLLTLTGPGGTGKTRLALQAAAEASDRYPDGIWWVPLAALRDSALLLAAVAQALGVKEQPGRDLDETLTAELAGKRALILLDNAEHLLPEAAEEIARLVPTSGPALLVTSRERLQLQGEQVYPVPTLAERDGVDLFLTRARTLEPAFAANGSVGELCSRLDNLPLALELAAARTTLFSPEQLLERLSQRLGLFKGARDADPRQRTLRATIEWSYDLLAPEEQRLFRSLSVFAGGCTYEAAEEVCGADPDNLHSLLDKSLLRRRDSTFGSRYWMLETIREYAAERLEKSGAAMALRRRHAEWCCVLAERLISLPGHMDEHGGDSEEGFERLEHENDNIQSALGWAWATDEDELGLRLGAACFKCWIVRAHFRDAAAWLEVAAPRIPLAPPRVQLQALKVAGLTAFFVLTDTEEADRYWARARAVAEQLGEADEIAWIESRRPASRGSEATSSSLASCTRQTWRKPVRAATATAKPTRSTYSVRCCATSDDSTRRSEHFSRPTPSIAGPAHRNQSSLRTPIASATWPSTEATSPQPLSSIARSSMSSAAARQGTSSFASRESRAFSPSVNVTRRRRRSGGRSAPPRRHWGFACWQQSGAATRVASHDWRAHQHGPRVGASHSRRR